MTVATVIEKGSEAQKHLMLLDSREAQTLLAALATYSAEHKRDRKAKALLKVLEQDLMCYF